MSAPPDIPTRPDTPLALSASAIGRVAPARVGARGIDCVTVLTLATATALRADGAEFAVRYLNALSSLEKGAILASGMAIQVVGGYSLRPGWSPSSGHGSSAGLDAVRLARALGLPAGLTVWYDLEGWVGPSQNAVDDVNAWADVVVKAGYEPGLYVGYADRPLTPDQLWGLAVVRYWHSCSIVPNVSRRGYCMIQEAPPNQVLAGVQVDRDRVQADLLGDVPHWLESPPATSAVA
jgi:hypothetical protein